MKKPQNKKTNFEDKFAKYAAMVSPHPDSKKNTGPTQAQKVKQAQRGGRDVAVVDKGKTNKKSNVDNVGKLLDEDLEVKGVPKEISTQVIQARNNAKLTQDQLANKISENVSALKDLENGVGVYDPKIVVKIEKTLGVKFTRSWKKKSD